MDRRKFVKALVVAPLVATEPLKAFHGKPAPQTSDALTTGPFVEYDIVGDRMAYIERRGDKVLHRDATAEEVKKYRG